MAIGMKATNEHAPPNWGKEALHTAEFENGFRVIYKQVPRPVSHCGLVINAGSRDEKHANGEAGVAILLSTPFSREPKSASPFTS